MTDADLGIPEEHEEDEVVEIEDAFSDANFYTEISTDLIYEVKFFSDFVLARPASPAFYLAIRKIDLITFSGEFVEYIGNPDQLRSYLWGGDETLMIIN